MDAQAVVRVSAGLLRGTREEGVVVYRGVPFAQPPVGSLRFRSPLPPVSWPGIRDASRPGPASYQINADNQGEVERIIQGIDPGVPGIMAWPDYTLATYRHSQAAEDCLYLDIWVPESAPRGDLPVYLYYHGGANMVSSGSFGLERGANLAREAGLIVVRPNYRLGALGWVHFGLLKRGDLPEAVNLGVQDQFAALRWVHENIAAFGGDPDNVTIGGESAGATAVSHLLTNPDTHPFFRRAVAQSLSPFNTWCTQRQPDAAAVARIYLDLLRAICRIASSHTVSNSWARPASGACARNDDVPGFLPVHPRASAAGQGGAPSQGRYILTEQIDDGTPGAAQLITLTAATHLRNAAKRRRTSRRRPAGCSQRADSVVF